MDIFEIDYSSSKGIKQYFPLAGSAYAAVLSLIFCIRNAFSGIYDLWFYCFLLLLVLSAIAILALTLRHRKPLVCITPQVLKFHIDHYKTQYDWDSIREINIGVSSFKIGNINGKVENINLEAIRYIDLKMLKSKIVELCEAKRIPYKNDY
jgi:hypothetical protein